jgi:hypothetical protein
VPNLLPASLLAPPHVRICSPTRATFTSTYQVYIGTTVTLSHNYLPIDGLSRHQEDHLNLRPRPLLADAHAVVVASVKIATSTSIAAKDLIPGVQLRTGDAIILCEDVAVVTVDCLLILVASRVDAIWLRRRRGRCLRRR